jgi:multimeric flavodoxin WrbA
MKLLGISAGRKMGNSEILLKEALMAAEATGDIDTEIIRLHDLKIRFCTGCEECVKPDNTEGCIIKDDMSFLKTRLAECDGLIIGSPTYILRPPAIFFAMNERFLGFGHKFLMDVYKRKRAGAIISVGGTDWTQMALPMLMMPFFMLNMTVVDKMQARWASAPGHVLLYGDIMNRAFDLGKNIAKAMKKTPEKTGYLGDDPGVCPYCHSSLLTAESGSVFSCPLCDIKGDLSMSSGELNIAWRSDDLQDIRWEPKGMGHHGEMIKENHISFEKNKEAVEKRIEKYREYKGYSRP